MFPWDVRSEEEDFVLSGRLDDYARINPRENHPGQVCLVSAVSSI